MPNAATMIDMSLDELADEDYGKARGKGKGKGKKSRDGPYGGDGGNCRVFVGNLPYSATWQDLKDHMRAAGNVVFCDILPEPGTALGSKGCGLVEYSTPAEAKKAIKTLTETEVRGRPIFVREDRENEGEELRWRVKGDRESEGGGRRDRGGERASSGGTSVFVGNLAFSVTWQDLKDHMREAGNVVHADIMKEPGTALGSKGCGLVQYSTAAEARRAIRDLTETELKGRNIFVREDREADNARPPMREPPARRAGPPAGRPRPTRRPSPSPSPPPRRDRGRGGGNCNVFVGNLPYSATWKDLKDHMRQAGDVVKADILPERGTTLGSKGCGLVSFSNARDAKRAIRELTDTMIGDRLIFVREDRE